MDQVQPHWTRDEGVILALNHHVTGRTWHTLTSTCTDLRKYATSNRCFEVEWTQKTKKYRLPLGITRLSMKGNNFCNLWMVPRSVHTLQVRSFWKIHDTAFFPDHIQHLDITTDKPQPLENWSYPSELISLKVNQGITPLIRLPERLTKLEVGGMVAYNYCPWIPYEPAELRWKLPPSLTYLDIGKNIQFTVNNWTLPTGLQVLKLGKYFIQDVSGWKLPSSLRELYMGQMFNNKVIGWELPESLEVLDMGDGFDKPVNQWTLPKNLRYLRFGRNFTQTVDGWLLPEKLTFLEFGPKFLRPLAGLHIPKTLTVLRISRDLEGRSSLPERVQKILEDVTRER